MPRGTTEDGARMRERILGSIVAHINVFGYPPTIREIAADVHLKSTSNVSHHLSVLEREGLIERSPGGARAIRIIEQTDALSHTEKGAPA